MRPFISLVIVVGVAACGGDSDVVVARQLPVAVQADATAIASADNQFACDIYTQLAGTPGNLFLSPFSLATALGMVDAGAAGATDLELRTALHLELPGERAHAAIGAMLASLDTGRSYGAYTLATANRLFGQTGFPFQDGYLAVTKHDYGAELMPVDFSAAPQAARSTINGWVAAQTDNKIPELFSSDLINESTVLALANAILFKGTWAHKFDHDRTAPAPFQLANGQIVQARMMSTNEVLAIAAIPGGSLGVLPFDGKDLSMIIALPDSADGLPAIEAELTGATIAHWIESATPGSTPVPVTLPRFSITAEPAVGDALRLLGVVSVFDPQTADLSGIDGKRDLYLEALVHKAVIQVDENGAEAAAATGGSIGTTSASSGFTVDRPFVFFIFDHVTGTILFMGRVADPTAG